MLDKQEIKAVLERGGARYSAVFAVRCAMRVLPVLGAFPFYKKAFFYWEAGEIDKHLFAVLLAQRVSIYIITNNSSNRVGYLTAHVAAAADDAATYAAADAAAATYAAADAAAAAAAAAASIRNKKYSNHIIQAFNQDIRSLSALQDTKSQNSKHSLSNFLQSPLWPDNIIPTEWQHDWDKFWQAAELREAGFEGWKLWFNDRVLGKPLDFDLLEKQCEIPAEILNQDISTINVYLSQLESGRASKPLNLVRAIFIGNGAAGKTSLIRALHNESVIEGKEPMTPGISIREWPVANTGIIARFWDFGGQVMTHATHQFFLRERCLYILVLDARSETNANDQAEYWLEHVKAFGKNATVMLVGNKADLVSVNLDMRSLKEKHPNIVGFYPLSCTQKDGGYQEKFIVFKQDLMQQLEKVGTHQVFFTPQQFDVLNLVRKLSRQSALLSHNAYERLCEENGVGINDEQNREWLLDLLDKLGEVIYFPKMSGLNTYVLNPRWLTYGVYTLLYSNALKQGEGELSENDVIDILNNENISDEQGCLLTYPKDKCHFIVNAMEEFKLCYRLSHDRRRFVIPGSLPTDQPDHVFKKEIKGTLIFEFAFRGFLPRHIMPMLIVSRHEEILDNWVWQNGVVLKNKKHNTTAFVQVDYHLRTFTLWVQGQGAREMLEILCDEVIKIIDRMSLEYDEWVVLPETARIKKDQTILENLQKPEKAKYKQLIANARAGDSIFRSESGTEYHLNLVMGNIMSDEKRQSEGVTINNYNNNNSSAKSQQQQSSVNTTQTQISIEIKNETTLELSGLLDNLKEDLLDNTNDEQAKQTISREFEKMDKALADIQNVTSSEEAKAKARSFTRLKSLIEKMQDGNVTLGKAIKTIENGLGQAQKLAALYNKIAPLCGIPCIPEFFLKSRKDSKKPELATET